MMENLPKYNNKLITYLICQFYPEFNSLIKFVKMNNNGLFDDTCNDNVEYISFDKYDKLEDIIKYVRVCLYV